MYRYLGLMVLVMCIGCGDSTPAPTPSPTIGEAVPVSTEVLETPPPRPGINYPPDPQSVVQSFLSALQIAPDDIDLSIYLTEEFQTQLAADQAVSKVLGPEPLEWFEVKTPERIDASTVTVSATLHFAANDDQRRFTLTQDTPGIWQIHTISP